VQHLGIDLGTANTVVYHSKRGVILDEPSVMTVEIGRRHAQLLTIGHDARSLIGRSSPGVTVVRPLEDGVITDLETARMFITGILRGVPLRAWQRWRVRAVIGTPVGATPLERRALLEAADEARIGRAVTVPEAIAGAVGCGIDPLEPRTHMVVDVGGGTAEVAAFTFGSLVAHRSTRIAGNEMTIAVSEYLRHEHQILVSDPVAEDIKIKATTAASPALTVQGQDLVYGKPRLITLPVEEVVAAIRPAAEAIIETLKLCLEDLPPQSINDITDEGVTAFGGGSLLHGFDTLLEEAFGLTVRLAEHPLTCVAEGAAACLERPELLRAFANT
jgi:rod shape-determining protein MreB